MKKEYDKFKDNPAADLLKIIDEAEHETDIDPKMNGIPYRQLYKDKLMMKLCAYVVRRDHKVWNHAFNLGKQKGVEKPPAKAD